MRIFDGGDLVEEYDAPEGKGHLIGLDRGHYDKLRADRQMQARKFGGGSGKRNRKGRAKIKRTISPVVPKYPVMVEPIVEQRSMDVYARLGGEVCYA